MATLPKSFVDRVEAASARQDIAALQQMSRELLMPAAAGPRPYSAAVQLTPGGRATLLGTGPLAPAAAPASTLRELAHEDDIAIDVANLLTRAERRVAYDLRRLTDPDALRIVAEGDSWFAYPPIILSDVISALMGPYAVCSLAAAGDTVDAMVRSSEYLDAIAAEQPALFLFSGGGNDLVGDGRMATFLRPYSAGAQAAALIHQGVLDAAIAGVISGYRRILTTLATRCPGLPMLSHSYDHSMNLTVGPWVWPFMVANHIPLATAHEIVALMLDQFGRALDTLHGVFPNFHHVRVTGAVGAAPGDWYDALHPRSPGFARVADKFIAKIDMLTASDALMQTAIAASRRVQPKTVMVATEPVDRWEMPAAATASVAIRTTPNVQALVRMSTQFPDADIPAWNDFGPETGWRPFDDPTVHRHIADVISLLHARREPEDPVRVAQRARMRPWAMTSHAGSPGGPTAELPAGAMSGDHALEPIGSLLAGYRAGRAVGRVARRLSIGGTQALGSGFLVGPGLLLTNAHVMPTAADALRCVLIMDDEACLHGAPPAPHRFRLTPDVYLADPLLDFAFVSIEPVANDGTALADYGYFELHPESGKALKGECLSLIQHPLGGPKAISVRSALLMGRAGDGVYSTADSQPGSSGAVVLNREWQAVALYHRVVPHPALPHQYLANRSIRISSILERVSAGAAPNDAWTAAMANKVLALVATRPLASTGSLQDGAVPEAISGDRMHEGAPALIPSVPPSKSAAAVWTPPLTVRDDALLRQYASLDGDEHSMIDHDGPISRGPRPFAADVSPRALSWDDVTWVSVATNNPDYWHLPAAAEQATFAVTPSLIEALIAAGRYKPYFTPAGQLIVAVRGAAILGGGAVLCDATSISVVEQKPDHIQPRCLVCVYDRARGLVSAFQGSTVPSRGGVVAQYNKNIGLPGAACSLLPTGCYAASIGTSHGQVIVPGLLRLGTGRGDDAALRVTVLRTLNDGIYSTADYWDLCQPLTTVRPAFSADSATFASLGCVTVPGSYSDGVHHGVWAQFRAAAGLELVANEAAHYDMLLTTGMEMAAMASALRRDGLSEQALVRLSHGSRGDEVSALQRALGIGVSGTFDASTKLTLTRLEQKMLNGNATGIYSVRSEQELRLGVLTTL